MTKSGFADMTILLAVYYLVYDGLKRVKFRQGLGARQLEAPSLVYWHLWTQYSWIAMVICNILFISRTVLCPRVATLS